MSTLRVTLPFPLGMSRTVAVHDVLWVEIPVSTHAQLHARHRRRFIWYASARLVFLDSINPYPSLIINSYPDQLLVDTLTDQSRINPVIPYQSGCM